MSARSNIPWDVLSKDHAVLTARLVDTFNRANSALGEAIFRNLNEDDYRGNSIPAVTRMIVESDGLVSILGCRTDGEGIICFTAGVVFEVSSREYQVIVTSLPTTIEIMSHLQENSQYDAAQVLSNLASAMTTKTTEGTK
jgi:hypothetical protein